MRQEEKQAAAAAQELLKAEAMSEKPRPCFSDLAADGGCRASLGDSTTSGCHLVCKLAKADGGHRARHLYLDGYLHVPGDELMDVAW